MTTILVIGLMAALLGTAFTLLKERRARHELEEKLAARTLAVDAQESAGLALESEKSRFQNLLNEISHGFLIVNENLEIEFANETLEKLFARDGFHRDRPLIEIFRDHRLVEVVREAYEQRRRASGEIIIQVSEGASGESFDRVYEIEAAPLPDDPAAGCWVMIRDVTDQVMTEQVRKDFVANASHELRTPLTLINGYIETLQDGLLDDREAVEKSLGVMKKHGKRIARIIDDMLTISKLESDVTPLRREAFDVAECVADVADTLAVIEAKEAVVEFDFPDGDHSMVGDRYYWDQVFMNLIENALKQNQRPGLRVTVSFQNDGDHYLIKVVDNGVGITRADLPYVFNRFFRGAKHHSKEIRGTGLGLSIVKRAVEAHGGEITVESTPGIETVFIVAVPVGGAEARTEGGESNPTAIETGPVSAPGTRS